MSKIPRSTVPITKKSWTKLTVFLFIKGCLWYTQVPPILGKLWKSLIFSTIFQTYICTSRYVTAVHTCTVHVNDCTKNCHEAPHVYSRIIFCSHTGILHIVKPLRPSKRPINGSTARKSYTFLLSIIDFYAEQNRARWKN